MLWPIMKVGRAAFVDWPRFSVSPEVVSEETRDNANNLYETNLNCEI